jgi:excisionase family DNA binding protein
MKQPPTMPDLTATQIARLFGMSKRTIHRLIKSGAMKVYQGEQPSDRRQSPMRVRRSDLVAFIMAHQFRPADADNNQLEINPMQDSSFEFLSVKEVAGILKMSRASVYRQIELKELRAFRLGGTVRVALTDLNAYIAKCATRPPDDAP